MAELNLYIENKDSMDMSEQQNMQDLGFSGALRHWEPMSRHVSWRAGGLAKCVYTPTDIADLSVFLAHLPKAEAIYFVGLGSNLLVRDSGFDGTIIFMHRALSAMQVLLKNDIGSISAQAGVPCPKVARFAALNNLQGAEFLAGIPGTLGGAIAMNAGCYGSETWDAIVKVTTINRQGEIKVRARDAYQIAYRNVHLQTVPVVAEHIDLGAASLDFEWFVAATLQLQAGDGAQSRLKIKDFLARRIATQPLGQPNAGSVFRNPPGDYAARLIESCGLKGYAIGGAEISTKHANFIVNKGSATASDIEGLITLAQHTVEIRCGIKLECEVRLIGGAR
jgi:UDP-N-acetylmuramate dehydrogenase